MSTTRTTKLARHIHFMKSDGKFVLCGVTEKGALHRIEFSCHDIGTLLCGVRTLSTAITEIVNDERGTHRYARDTLSQKWHELNAAVGTETKP